MRSKLKNVWAYSTDCDYLICFKSHFWPIFAQILTKISIYWSRDPNSKIVRREPFTGRWEEAFTGQILQRYYHTIEILHLLYTTLQCI